MRAQRSPYILRTWHERSLRKLASGSRGELIEPICKFHGQLTSTRTYNSKENEATQHLELQFRAPGSRKLFHGRSVTRSDWPVRPDMRLEIPAAWDRRAVARPAANGFTRGQLWDPVLQVIQGRCERGFFFWHLFGSVDIHIGKAIGPEKVNDLKPPLMGANADLQPPRHAGERRIPRTGFYIFTYISYCRANPRLRPRRLVKMGYHKCAGYVGLVHTTLGRAASSS